jgi:hypothetical protein
MLWVFQATKSYCFYEDNSFLLSPIDIEGILGMKYTPTVGLSAEGTFIPLFELLEYCFKVGSTIIAVDLLKGIGDIP